MTVRRGDLFSPQCPTRDMLDRVGGKWASMLVKLLADAPEVRFSELKRGARGISQKMLAQTLRELERDGLVSRRVEPTVPPRVYYALTKLGRSLEGALAILRRWAEGHMVEIQRERARYDRRAIT